MAPQVHFSRAAFTFVLVVLFRPTAQIVNQDVRLAIFWHAVFSLRPQHAPLSVRGEFRRARYLLLTGIQSQFELLSETKFLGSLPLRKNLVHNYDSFALPLSVASRG